MNRSPVPILPDRALSVAAVDKLGHESVFAYPEVRCESGGCPGRPQRTRRFGARLG
jgi:hypothetical protein